MSIFFEDARGRLVRLSLDGRQFASIGRDGRCDIVLDDHSVSRRHASVEAVQGQHLLRDGGSSNGTYLNGLRVPLGSAFSLRAGDIIEIGATRLTYGREPEPSTPGLTGELDHDSFELSDLVKDGHAALAPELRARVRAEILGHFAGVRRIVALERCLAVVATQLETHSAAIFLAAGDELRLVAGAPTMEAGGTLHGFARRAWSARKGRLLRGFGPHLAASRADGSTAQQAHTSGAAVPLSDGARTFGAVAIERTAARWLDRSDLTRLAVLADSVASGWNLEIADPNDTPPGGL